MINLKYMKFKVTENENISTVFLDGEIDMDIADNVREVVFPLIDCWQRSSFKFKRCSIHGLIRYISNCRE